jgi:DNA repair protein RadC
MTNEVNALLAQMGGYPNEVASTFLYRKGKLIKTIEKQGHGNTVSQNLTDLIADAVEAKADAVIFAHNHPSGT